MDLQQRFSNLLLKYTDNTEVIHNLWKEIQEKYNEKHRAYHNLNHLKELFTNFDIYVNELIKPDLVSLSIFYHDVIYNVWSKDNEERSATFAQNKLSGIINYNDLKEIHQQIIATKTHCTNDNDTKWLLDFDLAILGKSEKNYTEYTKLIRKEYKTIPNIIYKKGRKKVLQHFINKPFIFATDSFRSLYDNKAKNNLTNELKNI